MAKNNMLLGYARGKVGDIVFQRRKGEQIIKARNRNPNNPRTWSQQMQRVRMYAPVAFYKKAIENFFRFAFETKKPNETDYNAFMRENLNAFQGPYFTRSQVQQKFPVLAPYIMSTGNLGQIPFTFQQTSSDTGVSMYIPAPSITDETDNSIQAWSSALINDYGLENGDMLTFVMVNVKGIKITDTQIEYSGTTSFVYKQFIIDLEDTRRVNQVYGTTFTINAAGGVLDDGFNVKFGINSESGDATGYALITTRRSNGKVVASESRLELNDFAQEYFEHMSTSQQLLIAAQSYDANYSALDPKSSSARGTSTSRTGSRTGESQKNIAFGCLPDSGMKTTSGIPPYTLDNECPTCGCPVDEPEPEPEPCEQINATKRSSRKTSTSQATE